MTCIVVDSETELRSLALEDAPKLFALTDANRAYLRQWLPWLDGVRVLGDTETFIAKMILTYQENKAITAGIWRRSELVGVVGHNRIEVENQIGHIGYWLAEGMQNRGIMTRSVRALIEHSFASMKLNRVEICTAVGNHRSEAIPRRLGFGHEGVRRHGERLYDRFVDLNVFAMLRYQWTNAR
jgi:ribosomal-protein-serine acetyltransferase